MTEQVHGVVSVAVVDNPAEIAASNSPKGKPFLRLTIPGVDAPVAITTTIAEMIGGVGAGARKRYEDRLRTSN